MNYNRYNHNQSESWQKPGQHAHLAHWQNQEAKANLPYWQIQEQNANLPYRQMQEQNTHIPHWQRRISIEEAMNIALGQVPGQVVKVELDHEKGVLVYEVDIVTAQGVKYEVIVDVNNGTILEVKLD